MTKLDTMKAKNTHYFKAWNTDYRIGGRYYSLDNTEFRTIVILQSYSNDSGYIQKADANGYTMRELGDMIGINYRTLTKVLSNLESKEMIYIEPETTVIKLNHFINDNCYRQIDTKATRRSIEMHKQLDRIESKLDNNDSSNEATAIEV